MRTIPKSRRNPQFGQDELSAALKHRRIAYRHMPGLGGLRHPKKDSINTGWKNASFRGYADYMQTPPFAEAFHEMFELAREQPLALMCAEAVPWRCHRSLIADALLAHGVAVRDIMSPTRATPHKLTPFAQVEGTQVTYPAIV